MKETATRQIQNLYKGKDAKEIATGQIQNLCNEKYVKGIDTRQKCNETDMNRFIPPLKTQRQEIQN